MAKIAIDFDGTLVEHKFPEIGPKINEDLWAWLKDRQAKGDIIILWTCRTNGIIDSRQYLTEAVDFCAANGLMLDGANEDPNPDPAFPDKGRKLFADLYIDDRALNPFHVPVTQVGKYYLGKPDFNTGDGNT